MASQIEGIFVPTITPYDERGLINEGELRRIVSWLIESGVSGLYPNGSLGEFVRLSFEERKKVVSIVADEARGRVPILAGAAEGNVEMTIEMASHCAEIGCRAISLTGPYYYRPSQESIEAYFREVARVTPIDIVVYNIPMFANEISLPVLERLALDFERIVGTKDSSKDFCRFQQVIHLIKSRRPEFSTLIGWEELLVPSLFMGGDGGTLSTCGVAPEVIMKIYHLARSGRWDDARSMQYRLLELFQTMVTTPSFPEGFRLGYEARGFRIGNARFPVSEKESVQRELMRETIACLLGEFGFPEAADQCRILKNALLLPSSDRLRELTDKAIDRYLAQTQGGRRVTELSAFSRR